MKVTLKDIAKRLGVSHATVSLALNNSPKIADATREKVKAAAKEMGYRASPYVSALMAARRIGRDLTQAPVIALLTPNQTERHWKERHHLRRFINSCVATAEGLGIRAELFWMGEENMTARRMNDILYNRGIRGAVLMTHGVWGTRMDHSWTELATVNYGARELKPDTDWVAADFYGNMELTLGVLQENQFTKVGFAMDKPYHYEQDNRWLAAYLMGQQRGRIEAIEPWVDGAPDFEGFKQWYLKQRPEVIICVHPPIVISWLQQLGVGVPENVSVVAIGTADSAESVSGIAENTHACGKLAIEMLIDRIQRGEFGTYDEPCHISVKGQWSRGQTMRYV